MRGGRERPVLTNPSMRRNPARTRILPPMNWREMAHRLPFALAAVAGAVLGHALTYLVTVPNADARAEVLAGTGHGYWPLAVATAVALSLLSAGTTITRRLPP